MCEICNGTGTTNYIDVWKCRQFNKEGKQDWSVDDVVRPGCPCPICKSDDFWGWIAARIERDGQPFTDGTIASACRYQTPDGRVAMMPSTRTK